MTLVLAVVLLAVLLRLVPQPDVNAMWQSERGQLDTDSPTPGASRSRHPGPGPQQETT